MFKRLTLAVVWTIDQRGTRAELGRPVKRLLMVDYGIDKGGGEKELESGCILRRK